MRTSTVTEHQLFVCDGAFKTFVPAYAGMYAEARELVQAGRIFEGIAEAERSHISNYGHMRGVRFRVQTKSVTITAVSHLDCEVIL